MKKTVLISILVIITTLTYSQKQLVGINGGVIYSNVKINSELLKERTFRNDWVANINYERFFTNKISSEIGLQYERKGFVNKLVFTNEFGEEIMNENLPYLYEYISIPISVKYSIGNKVKGVGQLGIVPSYFYNGEIEYPDIMKPAIPDTPLNENANTFDFGALIGIGISYQILKKIELNVNGIFNHSFISMTNENFFEDDEMYNYYYSISFGIKYIFKEE